MSSCKAEGVPSFLIEDWCCITHVEIATNGSPYWGTTSTCLRIELTKIFDWIRGHYPLFQKASRWVSRPINYYKCQRETIISIGSTCAIYGWSGWRSAIIHHMNYIRAHSASSLRGIDCKLVVLLDALQKTQALRSAIDCVRIHGLIVIPPSSTYLGWINTSWEQVDVVSLIEEDHAWK